MWSTRRFEYRDFLSYWGSEEIGISGLPIFTFILDCRVFCGRTPDSLRTNLFFPMFQICCCVFVVNILTIFICQSVFWLFDGICCFGISIPTLSWSNTLPRLIRRFWRFVSSFPKFRPVLTFFDVSFFGFYDNHHQSSLFPSFPFHRQRTCQTWQFLNCPNCSFPVMVGLTGYSSWTVKLHLAYHPSCQIMWPSKIIHYYSQLLKS